MDDEGQSQLNSSGKKKGEDGNGHNGTSSSPTRSANSGGGRFMSRSEGLRSTGSGTGGYFSTRSSKMKGKVPGRSLADLASRYTSGSGRTQNHRDVHPHGHSHSHGSTHREESTSGTGRLSSLRGGADLSEEKKIVRFTRERLLSMRPRPEADVAPPSSLGCLEGTALMSNEPLDPGTYLLTILRFEKKTVCFLILHISFVICVLRNTNILILPIFICFLSHLNHNVRVNRNNILKFVGIVLMQMKSGLK